MPYLFASDKATLTSHTGSQLVYPVYMSTGIIPKALRSKSSLGAWVPIAYLPVSDFTDPKAIQTTLKARFFHQCMRVVTKSLRKPGHEGAKMADSAGNVRLCYPQLASWICDYPEQTLITCSPANASPITTAGGANLGDPLPHPPRTFQHQMDLIRELRDSVDPRNVAAYQKAAKAKGLSGVDRPLWEFLAGYSPERMAPDLLHGVYRFNRDHLLQWVIRLLGQEEFDRRLMALQPRVGFRHFKEGISKLKQWSGRLDKEIMSVLVAICADAVPTAAMEAIRALVDFQYLAAYQSHNTETLGYLSTALATFHAKKDIFIKEGVRKGKKEVLNHFNIPKLAGLHAFNLLIPQLGSAPQFDTEISEHLHITDAKDLYRATNKKLDYHGQMCQVLQRRETLSFYKRYFTWMEKTASERELMKHIGRLSKNEQDLHRLMLNQVDPNEPTRLLKKSKAKHRLSGVIRIALKPNIPYEPISALATRYQLPSLRSAIDSYLKAHPKHPLPPIPHQLEVCAWLQCYFQTGLIQDENVLAPPRCIQALPPTREMPYGRCNPVLVNLAPEAGRAGMEG